MRLQNVSKTEQVSFVFHYALHGEILETFLTYKDVVSTTGKSLFDTLQNLLDESDLNIKDIRGFGTDGAANMLGEYRGLKSRVGEVNPLAKNVHCACHVINLILVQACTGNVKIKVFFANVEEIYPFIEASPKRHDHFKRIQKEMSITPVRSLKRHASTRWESHSKVLADVKATYPAIITMLEEVIQEENSADVLTKANGLLNFAKEFEFTLMTVVFSEILQITNILSKSLQANEIDLSEAFLQIDSCIKELQALRSDAKLEGFIQKATALAKEADTET